MPNEPRDDVHITDIENKLEQARHLLGEERFQEALTLCKRISSENADNPTALMLQGNAHSQLWNFPDAISCLESAINLRPDFPEANYHLGNTWALLGKHEKALPYLDKATRLMPDYVSAWLLQAESFEALGQFIRAVECYEHAVKLQSENPKAWIALARTQQKLGNIEAAEKHYRTVLEINPALPDIHNNLGLIYQNEERIDEAEKEYRIALKHNPAHTKALVNLSNILRARDDLPAALAALKQALVHHPDRADLHYNFGIILIDMKQYHDAERSFKDALKIKPDYGLAHTRLGDLYRLAGNREGSELHYRQSIDLNTEDKDYAAYMLAALGTSNIPTKSPANYVRDQFDNYAERFDRHLVDELGYKVPEYLYQAVHLTLRNTAKTYNIIDLGCGTGLCGPLFRDIASHLTGIDLSKKMINKAHKRGVYDVLHTGEIVEFLRLKNRTYDIILATDVFVYIGDLSDIFNVCEQALTLGGLFAFSIEVSNNDPSYTLNTSGRYSQTPRYIHELIDTTGFTEIQSHNVTLRHENNIPVNGQIFVLRSGTNK